MPRSEDLPRPVWPEPMVAAARAGTEADADWYEIIAPAKALFFIEEEAHFRFADLTRRLRRLCRNACARVGAR